MKRERLTPIGGGPAFWLKALPAAGAAAFGVGCLLAPGRTWAGLLMANMLLTWVSLGAGVFLAAQTLAGARWSTALRRVPEAMLSYLPAGAALTALSLLGAGKLYPWAGPGAAALSKGGYLTPFWVGARAALCWLAWLTLSRRMVRRGDRASAATFVVVFAVTFTLYSVDWLMTMDARWSSTIYAWYAFSGAFVAALAALVVLLLWVQRRGALTELNEHHLHDLGKYLFAFSCFWAYLWFSQGLLIWYSNLPEETIYYVRRLDGGWVVVFWAVPLLSFVIPFVLLLSARAKKSRRVLLAACLVILAGRWLDLYLMVMPGAPGSSPIPGVVELLVAAGAVGAGAWLFDRSFCARETLPVGDPALEESLRFHGA